MSDGYELEELTRIETALDALVSPTSADVFQATRPYDERAIASVAAKRAGGGGGGSQPLLEMSGPMSAAQILALNSSPITLVPGTLGALTVPDTLWLFYASGVTPYSFAGSLLLDVANLLAQGIQFALSHTLTMLTFGAPNDAATDDVGANLGGNFNAADTSAVLGHGLVLSAESADPTLGDLAFTYNLTYRVIVP